LTVLVLFLQMKSWGIWKPQTKT